MGRQTALHMLSEDCKQLIDFVQKRDPVIVVLRDGQSSEVAEVQCAWQTGGTYCLWNQALLPSLRREFIPQSNAGPYYRVDDDLAVIELWFQNPTQPAWNGRPVLTQGRVYTGINANKGEAFASWYNAIVRWIRKNFVRNPIPHLGGFVGPAAYAWYREGGTLLPVFHPPATPQWLSWMEAQDQHRRLFSNNINPL